MLTSRLQHNQIQEVAIIRHTPSTVAPALKALLEGFIDYAGVFPPAALPVDDAVRNYVEYRKSEHAWMLRWFVIGASGLTGVPKSLDGSLSVIAEEDEARAATVESKGVIRARRPVYCEVAVDKLQELDAVQQAGCYAKIRTGGMKPEALPQPHEVAAFIVGCAERRLAFKATAGLHHPVRALHRLTYDAHAPEGIMHGFLNVLMAAAFAWSGEHQIEPIIADMDARSFRFDDRAHWHDRSLNLTEIRDMRSKFMHSVGSCSFDEPVEDLKALGLL